jgi:hypothetical protein
MTEITPRIFSDHTERKLELINKKKSAKQGAVTHTHTLGYSGGRDAKDCGSMVTATNKMGVPDAHGSYLQS